ncbi:unnamed protein product, partial [Amoebophrya sp. A120]|eukprot:GSA120T00004467001.1
MLRVKPQPDGICHFFFPHDKESAVHQLELVQQLKHLLSPPIPNLHSFLRKNYEIFSIY